MRRTSILCCLLFAFVVTVGCSRDSSKQAQNQPQADQSATQTQQPPAATQPPAPAEQPPPPAEAKPATTTTKPAQAATASTPPAATKPAPPKPVQPTFVDVPAGTVLNVRLDQPISTKSNKAGDAFTATVSEAITVGGATVIPRGAQVTGTVADAASAGRLKGGAKLALQLSKITVGTSPYSISASLAQESKGRGKRTAVGAGGGAGLGAVVGGIAGGGKGAGIGALVGGAAGTAGTAMTGERDISLPAEQSLSFKLDKPVRVATRPSQNVAR